MWARAEFDRWETEVSTTQSKNQKVGDEVVTKKDDPTDGENNMKGDKSLTEAEKLKLKIKQDQTALKSDSDISNKSKVF